MDLSNKQKYSYLREEEKKFFFIPSFRIYIFFRFKLYLVQLCTFQFMNIRNTQLLRGTKSCYERLLYSLYLPKFDLQKQSSNTAVRLMFLECKSDHIISLDVSILPGTHSSPLSTRYLLFMVSLWLFSPRYRHHCCFSSLKTTAFGCISLNSVFLSPLAVYMLPLEEPSPSGWLGSMSRIIFTFHQLLRKPPQHLPCCGTHPGHCDRQCA